MTTPNRAFGTSKSIPKIEITEHDSPIMVKVKAQRSKQELETCNDLKILLDFKPHKKSKKPPLDESKRKNPDIVVDEATPFKDHKKKFNRKLSMPILEFNSFTEHVQANTTREVKEIKKSVRI